MSPPSTGPRGHAAMRAKAIARNKTCRHFGGVNDGTIALLCALRDQSGLPMDRLLYKLARQGQKVGV